MTQSDNASLGPVLRSRRPQTRLDTSCTRTGRPRGYPSDDRRSGGRRLRPYGPCVRPRAAGDAASAAAGLSAAGSPGLRPTADAAAGLPASASAAGAALGTAGRASADVPTAAGLRPTPATSTRAATAVRAPAAAPARVPAGVPTAGRAAAARDALRSSLVPQPVHGPRVGGRFF